MAADGRRRGGRFLIVLAAVLVAGAAATAWRAGDDGDDSEEPRNRSTATRKGSPGEPVDHSEHAASGKYGPTVEPGSSDIGATAPDFTLPHLDGSGASSLRDFRGRVVLLNFWGSWCIACRTEFPTLRTYRKRHPDGAVVVGVTYKDIPSDAREFAREFRSTWLQLDGGRDNPVAKEYGIRAAPQLYVIDADGIIRERLFGSPPLEEIEQAVRAASRAR